MPVSHTRVSPALPPVVVTDSEIGGLLEVLGRVPDPRNRRGVRHGLVAVLTISVIAVFAGAQNFHEIGDEAADLPPQILARVKARWCLRRLRWVAPSAATIRRVIGDVDADLLDEVIYQWLRTRTGWDTRDNQQDWLLALDGKTCTGASRPGDEVKLFSALVHGQATVIAQLRVPEGTNEITQVRPLLSGLNITGAWITADAAHTQRDTAVFLVEECHADYLAQVKGNQPSLQQAISDRLAHRNRKLPDHLDREHNRGRITERSIWVQPADGIDWPHATQVFLIRREVLDLSEARISREFVFGITSRAANRAAPAQINAAVRSHWHIENRAHLVRDVTFGEDAHQAYLGATPQVLATLRNLALSLIRLAGGNEIKRTLQHIRRDRTRALNLIGLTTTSTTTLQWRWGDRRAGNRVLPTCDVA
jgi:predicted transposase YbfD/YdcC